MRINPAKKFREMPKLQEEVIELEKRLTEKKQALIERKEAEKHDRELIKEIIKEKTEIPAPVKITPPVVVKKVKTIKAEAKERQVKLLTDLAFDKGIIHATEVAKKLDDPYILDEFHDTLVDELYNYLVEQGKLKQI